MTTGRAIFGRAVDKGSSFRKPRVARERNWVLGMLCVQAGSALCTGRFRSTLDESSNHPRETFKFIHELEPRGLFNDNSSFHLTFRGVLGTFQQFIDDDDEKV